MGFHAAPSSDCQKSLAEFAPAGANKVKIIFSGGKWVRLQELSLIHILTRSKSAGGPGLLLHMVTWPSGKAKVCKTFIPQFESGRHLHMNEAVYASGEKPGASTVSGIFQNRIFSFKP